MLDQAIRFARVSDAHTHFLEPGGSRRYQAWVDHLNAVIDVSPLGARLDVPLLRRAAVENDQRAPVQQQKQQAVAGARLIRLLVSETLSVGMVQKQKSCLFLPQGVRKAPDGRYISICAHILVIGVRKTLAICMGGKKRCRIHF